MLLSRSLLLCTFLMITGATRAHAQAPYAERADELVRAQLSERLQLTRAHLQAQKHDYVLPAVGVGVGLATLAGGMTMTVFGAMRTGCVSDGGCESGGNDALRGFGLASVAVGTFLVLVSPPMLVVRAIRHARLKKIERQLAWLSSHATLAPEIGARRQASFSARFRF